MRALKYKGLASFQMTLSFLLGDLTDLCTERMIKFYNYFIVRCV